MGHPICPLLEINSYIGNLTSSYTSVIMFVLAGLFFNLRHHVRPRRPLLQPQPLQRHLRHHTEEEATWERWKTVNMYKIQWSHHAEEEATWETEDYLNRKFPGFLLQHDNSTLADGDYELVPTQGEGQSEGQLNVVEANQDPNQVSEDQPTNFEFEGNPLEEVVANPWP
ncbi:unnamed protein product, partial [Urochloa humidicola]